MGRDIFVYRGHHAIINDFEIAALKHFLLLASSAAGFSEISEYVSGWKFVGNGVWVGIDELESVLRGMGTFERRFEHTLERARHHVLSFGERVPAEYLATHAAFDGAQWSDEPTELLLRAIDSLAKLLPSSR